MNKSYTSDYSPPRPPPGSRSGLQTVSHQASQKNQKKQDTVIEQAGRTGLCLLQRQLRATEDVTSHVKYTHAQIHIHNAH